MDDGRHTDYNTVNGAAGFPIIHTAPFARYGSSKVCFCILITLICDPQPGFYQGGAFSEGCLAYSFVANFHYGIIDITDDGAEEVCFHAKGYQEGINEPVMELKKCHPFVMKGAVSVHVCATIPAVFLHSSAWRGSLYTSASPSIFLLLGFHDYASGFGTAGNAHCGLLHAGEIEARVSSMVS